MKASVRGFITVVLLLSLCLIQQGTYLMTFGRPQTASAISGERTPDGEHSDSVLADSEIKIRFNDDAARYVLLHPQQALANERDSIWNRFEGYRITLMWHKGSSVPVTWNIWEKGLRRFLYKDTSLIRRSLDLADSLQSKIRREQQNITRHIISYSGKQAGLDAYVYFVAFTVPYAFCVEGNKIGIDLTADEWSFDTDCILNMTIHEIYHVGFEHHSPDYKHIEADPTDARTFLLFHYTYLQSEGMATYVGYKALDLYPSHYRHEDYRLLENDNEVKSAIGKVNQLVRMSRTSPIDTLISESWKKGVTERAYYVAGASMARTLEERFGADRLAELVSKGSIEFVKQYNALVPADRRIELMGALRGER